MLLKLKLSILKSGSFKASFDLIGLIIPFLKLV